MSGFLNWLDDRTGYKGLLHEALYERVPGGARWRYVWGSTLVVAFFIQVITGFFLWAAYSPNALGAWESVYYIQNEMQGGWLLRGVHHFMAQAMVILLVLHLMQVVIDGAYRAPREVNFWIGLILMQIVLGLSLTGYLLPWDQKGFWATKVATNIMAITPVVGPDLQKLVVGGSDYGHHTLTRFFAIHAGLLPGLLIALLALHIHVFRRHGLTAHRPDPARDAAFWPDQILKDAVASLAVLAAVLLLVCLPQLRGEPPGVELGAPANPTAPFSAARPEWYFLFLFQFLKYFPGESEVIGALVIPGAVMFVLFLMPIVGRWKLGHGFNVGFLFALMIGVVALTGVAMYEDANNPAFQAAKQEARRNAERVPLLIEAEGGIGPEGAAALLASDPLIQGPEIFAKQCAACHRYNGHDGLGHPVVENQDGKEVEPPPTATDLGNFGTREWMRSLLIDYKILFAPLENATWNGESVGATFLEDGDMVNWSEENKEVLLQNPDDLAALVEFVFAQAERSDMPPPNPELVARGREIFEFGELTDGELSSACVDCHSMHAVGEDEPLSEDGYAPMLTGYGSRKWLTEFISNPGAPVFYGDSNAMPAFAEKLSFEDLDMIARWLSGDYVPPAAEVASSEGEDVAAGSD